MTAMTEQPWDEAQWYWLSREEGHGMRRTYSFWPRAPVIFRLLPVHPSRVVPRLAHGDIPFEDNTDGKGGRDLDGQTGALPQGRRPPEKRSIQLVDGLVVVTERNGRRVLTTTSQDKLSAARIQCVRI